MVTRRSSSVGVFTTDRSLVVQSWDRWMVDATDIPETAAVGEHLARLFPSLEERGMLARLQRVADGAGVEMLAPVFHKYLIPCPPRDRTSRFERMRQRVTIAPLETPQGVAGVVVTIEDVTERFDRGRVAADLDSQDEAVRLKAAQMLAAEGDAPLLLANALSDNSWRVRRAAADGMARAPGAETTETLVEALRAHHRDPAVLNAALTAVTRTRSDITPAIIPLLAAEDIDLRTYAALALGLIGDSKAVPDLIARLDDADANVRFHAIEALGRIGDRRAADAIATIAESRDFFLAFPALDALAAIGEPAVASRLIPLLDDTMLFAATTACLGAIGAEDVAVPLATSLLDARMEITPVASALGAVYDRLEEELGEGALVADLAKGVITKDAAQRLIDTLPDANDDEVRALVLVLSWLSFDGIDAALARLLARPGSRVVAADRLAVRGIGAARFVEDAARAEGDDVRRVAARALGRIGSPDSVVVLLAWLNETTEADVLIAVSGALAAIGDRRAFAPLLELTGHAEATVRQAAVSALNSIGHPDTEAAVRIRLSDTSPVVRESAARIAGYFGHDSCLNEVVARCADPEVVVRRAAVEALGNYDDPIAWSTIESTLASDTDPSVRAAAARALGQSQSAGSLRALVAAMHDQNLWVRYFSIRALHHRLHHDGDAQNDVIAGLAERAGNDLVAPVRIAAIEALGTLDANSTNTLNVLLSLVRARESEVACAAIAALGAFDADQTASALSWALSQDDAQMQTAALDALGRQRATHAVADIEALARSDRGELLRRHAVHTLADIGSPAAFASLVALSADRQLRDCVVSALAGVAEDRVPAMWAETRDAPDHARELIVEAVGRMKHPAAARALAAALDDRAPVVRLAAARALSRLDVRDARTQLASLARGDENAGVRAAARDALARG